MKGIRKWIAHVRLQRRIRELRAWERRTGLILVMESLGSSQFDVLGYVLNGPLQIRSKLSVAADVAGAAGETGFSNASGVGNGAQTAITSPLLGTGTGPANAQIVTNFLKVYVAGAVRWLPVMT